MLGTGHQWTFIHVTGKGGSELRPEGTEKGADKGQEQVQREAGEQASAEQCQGGVLGNDGDHRTKFIWSCCGGQPRYCQWANQHFNRFDWTHSTRRLVGQVSLTSPSYDPLSLPCIIPVPKVRHPLELSMSHSSPPASITWPNEITWHMTFTVLYRFLLL